MLTQVEEEQVDLLPAEEPNADTVVVDGDESGQYPGRENEAANGSVSRGHSNGDVVVEKAPPTPAKDGDAARSSQTTVPEPASEGTSGSAS
jgi:hypothetical protein